MTAEHVLPRWIERAMAGLHTGRGEHRLEFHVGTEVHGGRGPWLGTPFSITVRAVCADCNNGWLSDLEQQAERVLSGPICGEQRAWAVADQMIAAVWIVKTALLWQLTAASERAAPDADYRWLYRRGVPTPGTRIWVGAFEGPDLLTYNHHGFAVHPIGTAPSDRDARGYSATFSIGGFAAHLFALGVGEHSREIAVEAPPLGRGGALFEWMREVWPTQGATSWPPDEPLSRTELTTISRVWLT